MAERDFKGVWIPREIWFAEDIGWSAKLLLVEIDSLAKNGECFASNDYFAQFFSLSKDRISKLISELKEKGYVEVNIIYKGNSKQIDKRLITTIGYRRKCLQGIGNCAYTDVCQTDHTPIGENAEDNNTSFDINTSFNNTDNKSVPAPERTKPIKHKHGEYGHVLLSTEDVEKLNAKYGSYLTEKAITFLDEYIEMKGYKAKNHYLAIRKWVIDAVKEREQKNGGGGAKSFDDDDFWDAAVNKTKAKRAAKTVGEDPELKARADNLKERLLA